MAEYISELSIQIVIIQMQKPTTQYSKIRATKPTNENTNLNSFAKTASSKRLPEKPVAEKKNYVVEENMTGSKIHEAKQGLQLLKKKNNKYEPPVKKQPIKKSNMKVEQPSTLKPKPSSIKPQKETYLDEKMEAPIKQKKNFNALLEEQMKREQESLNEKLVECPKGCGRMFNEEAIVKHEKVCKKVFQSKRKAFNSAAHRAPQVDELQKGLLKKVNKNQPEKLKPQKPNAIPKWKQESLAFRSMLKQAKNEPMTQEQKVLNEKIKKEADTRVQCKFCGRKFEEGVAKRHIPFCENKAKQMSKPPARKKK